MGELVRKVIKETSLRFHVEGTDSRHPEEDDWSFLGAAALLQSGKAETADQILREYEGRYRRVRIVDTRAE